MVLKFSLKMFLGIFFEVWGNFGPDYRTVTFIAFLPRERLVVWMYSYLYHCILCCVCELKQLS